MPTKLRCSAGARKETKTIQREPKPTMHTATAAAETVPREECLQRPCESMQHAQQQTRHASHDAARLKNQTGTPVTTMQCSREDKDKAKQRGGLKTSNHCCWNQLCPGVCVCFFAKQNLRTGAARSETEVMEGVNTARLVRAGTVVAALPAHTIHNTYSAN